MFANRFTALVDACSLVSALGRNTMLSLAEAELYRIRWSVDILVELERALGRIFTLRGIVGSDVLAARQVDAVRRAFPDALVVEYQCLVLDSAELPDADDAHVIAAARRCRASVLVTENLKHFLASVLETMGIEAKSSDDFIADAIDLDPLRAVAALATMRTRFENPHISSEYLLLQFESQGFIQTADLLRPYAAQL